MIDYAIATERLELRLARVSDAESIFQLHADPENVQFIPVVPRDVASARLFLLEQRQKFGNGQDILWAIRTQKDPAFIGLLHLENMDGREADVHFIIDWHHWGNGFVPEALGGVLEFVRHRLSLQRIRGWCDVENIQSASVFQKTGFCDLGTLPRPIWERITKDFRTFAYDLSRS